MTLSIQPSLPPGVRQASGTSGGCHHAPCVFRPQTPSPSMGSSPTQTSRHTRRSPWPVPPSPNQHSSRDLSLLPQGASLSGTHESFTPVPATSLAGAEAIVTFLDHPLPSSLRPLSTLWNQGELLTLKNFFKLVLLFLAMLMAGAKSPEQKLNLDPQQ